MAKIQIVVMNVEAKKFSGGMLCLFEYANALAQKGHEVRLTPLLKSEMPQWFEPRFTIDLSVNDLPARLPAAIGSGLNYLRARTTESKKRLKNDVASVARQISRFAGYNMLRSVVLENYRLIHGDADIVIATSFETALPVSAYARGRKFYFMQHYEPYFAVDSDRPETARLDAELTYHLPIQLVANSTWLEETIRERHGRTDVRVNPNAIRQSDFFPEGRADDASFVVISYGGRHATWKGFADAAQAIRLARQHVPNLIWRVYGDALLPPDNSIAPYEHLGFISGAALRQAYSRAHVLLSASWYESFPLFPLEAMACGTAVVTTPYGTEDYARHEDNSLIVPPKNPQAMADAIVRFSQDERLRERCSQRGIETGRLFTWERAASGLERILLEN